MANVTIDYAQQPKLKEVITNWETGKEYEVTLRMQLDSKDDKCATFTALECIMPDGTETKEIEPEAGEPIMITMRGGKPDAKEPVESEAEAAAYA